MCVHTEPSDEYESPFEEEGKGPIPSDQHDPRNRVKSDVGGSLSLSLSLSLFLFLPISSSLTCVECSYLFSPQAKLRAVMGKFYAHGFKEVSRL